MLATDSTRLGLWKTRNDLVAVLHYLAILAECVVSRVRIQKLTVSSTRQYHIRGQIAAP